MGKETFYWDGLTYAFCGGVKVGKTFWFMIYSYLTDNAFTGVKRGVRKGWAEIMKSGSKLTSNDNFSNSVHQKMDDLFRAL